MLKINHIAKTFNPGTITEKTALVDVQLHLKPGEEALDAAGHLVEALTLKRKEISGETPAEGGTL